MQHFAKEKTIWYKYIILVYLYMVPLFEKNETYGKKKNFAAGEYFKCTLHR